jgi:hypothetical protein
MNIFYIDTCPVKAAQMQCDKHVVKMVLESAQMLCTAHHEFGNHDVPYKVAHRNHPSTIWARSGLKQYVWLFRHFMALSDEYTERYGREHLTWQKCAYALFEPPMGIPDIEWTDPPQCMPDECKRETSLAGYTEYYFNYKPLVIDMRWPSHRQPTMERNYATA